ncbi:hypothetical protein C8R47DRAFT_1087965 [Mycena vitilis]|nr:hypothetical protein C8R47DRAFT_1087965 [Mycena vitilis]
MILLDEKTEQTSPSSSSLSPGSRYPPASPSYYTPSDFGSLSSAPSSSRSGGSSTLRPPNAQWPSNSSETALPSPRKSGQFPPLSATRSEAYLPVKPVPASSLTRSPPSNLPRTAFPPMFLLADGNSLKQGFPAVLPPSATQPHPFSLLDVNETDWTQFLSELRVIARLSEKERNTAYCIPILSAIPIINVAIAGAIMHHMQRKKPALVSLLVDKWNHYFFHQRNIEIILMRGQVKLSGQSDQPVAGLYTPRTVNFKAPPLGGENNTDTGAGAPKGSNKTYRLFIVSMDA